MELDQHLPDVLRHAAQAITRGPCVVPALLPLPAQTYSDLQQVLSHLETFLESAAASDVHQNLIMSLGGARSVLNDAVAEGDSGTISRVLNVLSQELLTSESAILQNCQAKVRQSFTSLQDATSAARRAFATDNYTISIVGLSSDLDDVQQSLLSVISQTIERYQATLAESYGWTRGKTTCCPDMGYNPPPDCKLPPVHDPKPQLAHFFNRAQVGSEDESAAPTKE